MCPRPPTLQMLAKARKNICKRSPPNQDKGKPNNAPKYKLLRSQKQGRPALVLKAQSMSKKTKRGQIYRVSHDTKKTKGAKVVPFRFPFIAATGQHQKFDQLPVISQIPSQLGIPILAKHRSSQS